MEIDIFHKKLSELYTCYNETIKPLIADIESKYQLFPDSIFNEIRAFNDHVARCYVKNITSDKIEKEISRAESHIIRITLDCYKYLSVWLYDYFEKFKIDFDISLIDNGEFAPYFYNIQALAVRVMREAKRNESYDKQAAYDKYQEAYNIYSGLYINIEEHLPKILWAKKIEINKRKNSIPKTVLLMTISAIISAIVSAIVPWKDFFDWIMAFIVHN